MGEAILVKAGGLGGSNGSDPEDQNIVDWQLKTELITNTKEYLVPKARNQEFTVMLFGGGGGLSSYINMMQLSGGYGNMNKGVLTLKRGDSINVVIGQAGRANEAGGTTTFGTYLSATGGGVGDIVNRIQAKGGIGLGAIIYTFWYNSGRWDNYYQQMDYSEGIYFPNINWSYPASDGTYGGGGGGISIKDSSNSSNIMYLKGGNGGIYGGGGGTYGSDTIKTGGNGCGNGGNGSKNATNGTNTVGKIIGDYNGYGEASLGNTTSKLYGGGGGYGGSGGTGAKSDWFSHTIEYCGGGGGYGYNGGSGYLTYRQTTSSGGFPNSWYSGNGYCVIFGGDGGGYGGMGYGPSGYGAGARYKYISSSQATNGICVLSYYAPVYNNG